MLLCPKWSGWLVDFAFGREGVHNRVIYIRVNERGNVGIFRFILETASGRRKTWAEHWGLANGLAPFNPWPVT